MAAHQVLLVVPACGRHGHSWKNGGISATSSNSDCVKGFQEPYLIGLIANVATAVWLLFRTSSPFQLYFTFSSYFPVIISVSTCCLDNHDSTVYSGLYHYSEWLSRQLMNGLNKHTAVPLYLQLKKLLEVQIAHGTLAPHSRVPSERELSEQFGISRMTVRQALAELIQEGRLYTSTGKGTFVSEPKIRQNVQALTSFTEEMQLRALKPTTQLLGCVLAPPSAEVARSLRIAEEASVVCLERLRLADGEPLALETAWLWFTGVERLLECNLAGSLYAVLQQEFGLIPVEAIQEFEAILPQQRERTMLHMQEGAPVLRLQRTTFDSERRAFEYVQSLYRGDRYRFVARLIREDGV